MRSRPLRGTGPHRGAVPSPFPRGAWERGGDAADRDPTMLTPRGWSFLLSVLALLAVGVFTRLAGLTVLSLTLLLWFVAEFVLFAVRAHSLHHRLEVRREVRDDRGPVTTLWAGRDFRVRVAVRS